MTQTGRNWEHIFQAIGHPSVILDPRHRIVDANQAVLRASGLSQTELIGRKCHEIFHGRECSSPPEGCPMERLLASGRLETVEGEMEAFGGIYLVSCAPVSDPKGRVKEIIHIATDIGERKRAEEEQRRSRETAERLAQEMAVIAEIGRVIGSTLDIGEFYERFAAEARKLIPFDRLAVNLCDHEKSAPCCPFLFFPGAV